MNYKFRVTVANNNYDLVVGYRPITFSEYGYEIVSKSDLIQSGGAYYADITFSITNFENSQGTYEKNNLACLDEYDNTLPIETYAFQYDLGNTALVSWMESENKDAKLHAKTDADRALVAVTQEISASVIQPRTVSKVTCKPLSIYRFAVLLSENDETVTKNVCISNDNIVDSTVTFPCTLTNTHIQSNSLNYFIGTFPLDHAFGRNILSASGTIKIYEEGTSNYSYLFTIECNGDPQGGIPDFEMAIDGTNFDIDDEYELAYVTNSSRVSSSTASFTYEAITNVICGEYEEYLATNTNETKNTIFSISPFVVALKDTTADVKTVVSSETVYSKVSVLNPYGITVAQQS